MIFKPTDYLRGVVVERCLEDERDTRICTLECGHETVVQRNSKALITASGRTRRSLFCRECLKEAKRSAL